MRALETRSDAMGFDLTRQCLAQRLLAIFAFNRQSTLQIMPPLVISADEIDEVLERFEAAVRAMEVRPEPRPAWAAAARGSRAPKRCGSGRD